LANTSRKESLKFSAEGGAASGGKVQGFDIKAIMENI